MLPALVLGLCSCEQYLTVTPDDRTVADGYFNTPQRVEQAVVGGYVDLRRALVANHAWLMYGDVRAGDLVAATDFSPLVAAQQLADRHFDLQKVTDWRYFYDVIESADEVLGIVETANAETLTDYQRNLYRGEALALKSIAYFYLTRIWGEIPSAEKGSLGQKLSNTAALEQAAAFARQSVELLPWMLLNDDGIESVVLSTIRFNKTSATLLLAQLELTRGKGTDAYTALSRLFVDEATDRRHGFAISMGEDRRTTISRTPLSGTLVHAPLATLNRIYPDGDPRRTRLFTVAQNRGTLIVRDQTQLPLLKLEELDLLSAEAAWRSGRMEEARQALVRVAAGAVENYAEVAEADFGDAVLKERQRLLIGTGQRFFDLMRFEQVSRHVPLSAADVAGGAAYWPLSAESISGNSLAQNSYWAR